MKIKVGDNVLVIAGADKGKTGKVTKTLKKENRVVVEGVHIVHKHIKPGRYNETGSIIEMEAPIHASNVKLVEETKKTTKTAKKTTKKESEK
jgi:large subunit ribosomal protein L24